MSVIRYGLYYYKNGLPHFFDESDDLQELIDEAASINFALHAIKKAKRKDLYKWIYVDRDGTVIDPMSIFEQMHRDD